MIRVQQKNCIKKERAFKHLICCYVTLELRIRLDICAADGTGVLRVLELGVELGVGDGFTNEVFDELVLLPRCAGVAPRIDRLKIVFEIAMTGEKIFIGKSLK